MKLALLGGTGRTGRPLIDQALERGHHLRVLARDPAKVHRQHPHLTVLQGDARDPEAVARLIEGVDAVVSVMGPVPGGPKDTMTVTARNLITLLPTHGVRRLITLTGAGVRHAGDRPNAVDRVFGLLLRLLQPDVLRDSLTHADLIRGSSLDWTVVRAPRLTDGPDAPVRVGKVGEIRPMVSRASVAHFMLDALDTDQYVRAAPAVSN